MFLFARSEVGFCQRVQECGENCPTKMARMPILLCRSGQWPRRKGICQNIIDIKQ
ncbi:hypothetical protein HP15_2534 [Marinobacter adhaerens HP15]|uniref:Uncharacterized protein n=1 Tax=Marinobacter adhaerens (strain DSM 23420 / HP15) TaxID=225937 RepID=E4PIP7_MARAH|nr:hypothetical protein HP15_2534 [Marinobacter adhaerens HP15]